ncbi:hypothetical protein NPS33_05775 [Pseudomonas putida]|uniref:hypothetical protein n=1 Tax=Pseudomonas putida TaxID=303 RepID=UPI0023634106|nr:hypothetical protein [Pseudomonas putida]MDD2014407.1 hypothetical protein [Pseudomonas putida]HDS1772026.1 hypothetical protein [Pseudomonas putida]
MPRENRSSNTEMVSVPRELIEAALADLPSDSQLGFELRPHLDQPAPQPHAEPIAWMVGTAFWWTKEEAERDEAATGLPIVGLGPMTGAAEVERLRVELGYMREERDDLSGKLDRFYSRTHGIKNLAAIEELSDKLAERDALLREALEFIDDGVGRSDAEWRLIKKVRAALSPDAGASATDEPYQGIPGTSFQRLNALANQGE